MNMNIKYIIYKYINKIYIRIIYIYIYEYSYIYEYKPNLDQFYVNMYQNNIK
jgi:hypothetical protein